MRVGVLGRPYAAKADGGPQQCAAARGEYRRVCSVVQSHCKCCVHVCARGDSMTRCPPCCCERKRRGVQDRDGALALLVPATLPVRLSAKGERYSSELFQLRRDTVGPIFHSFSCSGCRFVVCSSSAAQCFVVVPQAWLDNISVRSYLYPVHLSLAFLFTPTLASALFLLLLRLLNRYAAVTCGRCHQQTLTHAAQQAIRRSVPPC